MVPGCQRALWVDADAGQVDLSPSVLVAEEAQLRHLRARAVGLESDLGGAARRRDERDTSAVLVQQLEAGHVTAGNDGDEEAAGQLTVVGERDGLGAPLLPGRRRAEVGWIRRARDDRLASLPLRSAVKEEPFVVARTCAEYGIASFGPKFTCTVQVSFGCKVVPEQLMNPVQKAFDSGPDDVDRVDLHRGGAGVARAGSWSGCCRC